MNLLKRLYFIQNVVTNLDTRIKKLKKQDSVIYNNIINTGDIAISKSPRDIR